MPASSGTNQEKLVGEALTELGFRWVDQYPLGKYIVDFWVSEIGLVVEADGVYGHLRRRDRQRDKDLYGLGAEYIWHIKSKTKAKIKEELWQELENLQKIEIYDKDHQKE